MGMCKGCGQIFKTEDMKYGFCIDCQKIHKDKILEIENNIHEKFKYSENKNNLEEKSRVTSYFTTFFGSIAGFLISTYLSVELHAPKIVSIFAFLIVFFLVLFAFMKDTRPDVKGFWLNNKIIIKRLLIVFVVIWNILIYNLDDRHYVFLALIPTILIFGILWAFNGNKNNNVPRQ